MSCYDYSGCLVVVFVVIVFVVVAAVIVASSLVVIFLLFLLRLPALLISAFSTSAGSTPHAFIISMTRTPKTNKNFGRSLSAVLLLTTSKRIYIFQISIIRFFNLRGAVEQKVCH